MCRKSLALPRRPPVPWSAGGVSGVMLRIGLLGPLSIEVDGAIVDVASATQRRALIFLAIHANEVVSSDHLADAVWGVAAPSDPRHAVHSLIHRLRNRVIAGDGRSAGIVRHDPGYVLEIDPLHIDANAFCDQVSRARSIPEHRPAARRDVLSVALDLWRGDALMDVTYDSWAISEIRRLTELRVSACEALARANIDLGSGEIAIAELESLTERFPLRESLWLLLWEALAQASRHAEVTASFRRVEHILATDFGLSPSTHLRDAALEFADAVDA